MPDLRELLNELRWTKDFSKVAVWYLHRGAPQNKKMISGRDIVSIEKSSFSTQTSSIPFHRILLITYDAQVVFNRQSLKQK
jgi:uncharacterized protein (UPF0248 family)